MKTFLLLLLIAATSCSNDNSKDPVFQLPPETLIGANTFGCIINGKVMVPRNRLGNFLPGQKLNAVSVLSLDDYISISAGDGRDTNMGSLYLFIKKPKISLTIGVYNIYNGVMYSEITKPDNNSIFASVYRNGIRADYVSIENTGKINILKNDQIFAGTFFCKLKNINSPNDIIEIKSGRFDFNKNTINTTNFP